MAREQRCTRCGSAGAYAGLNEVECLLPWCSRFSVRLAADPFTLDDKTKRRYLDMMKTHATTPPDDQATLRKSREKLEDLLGSS